MSRSTCPPGSGGRGGDCQLARQARTRCPLLPWGTCLQLTLCTACTSVTASVLHHGRRSSMHSQHRSLLCMLHLRPWWSTFAVTDVHAPANSSGAPFGAHSLRLRMFTLRGCCGGALVCSFRRRRSAAPVVDYISPASAVHAAPARVADTSHCRRGETCWSHSVSTPAATRVQAHSARWRKSAEGFLIQCSFSSRLQACLASFVRHNKCHCHGCAVSSFNVTDAWAVSSITE